MYVDQYPFNSLMS